MFNPVLGPEEWQSTLERLVDWANSMPTVTVNEAFDKIAELLKAEHFGVESCKLEGTNDDSAAAEMRYLNMGETYALTLIVTDDYHNGEKLIVSSWGDWYEAAEQHYNEQHDTIRCGWCSNLTPMENTDEDREANGIPDDEVEWRLVLCEKCGNYVNGDSGPNRDRSGHPLEAKQHN